MMTERSISGSNLGVSPRLACYLSLALLFLGLTPVFAQDPAANIAAEPTPLPDNVPPAPATLPGLPDDVPLSSPTPDKVPALDQLDRMFKESSLGKAADEARLHAQWRTIANHVRHSPDLVAARARAERARTDDTKRKELRSYYMALFARMHAEAATPELRDYLEDRKAEHLFLLSEPKVRPETAIALPSPIATIKPQKHPKKGKAPEVSLPR
ncbi:MAG: hypothetical protein ABI839_05180 [Verrucomicrobiota bacterium]